MLSHHELSRIIKGIDYNVESVRRLNSFHHEVWELQCANDRNLILKTGMTAINWPYGEVIEVENEIRTLQALGRVVPEVVPPLISTGRLQSGSWYLIRYAVPNIYDLETHCPEDFGDKLVALVQTITDVKTSDALRKQSFMPTCDLQAEVTCLIKQLLPFSSVETARLITRIGNLALNLLDCLELPRQNVVCVGNFTPGNIGVLLDGSPCLIDCSVFRWGSNLYDLTKLFTYLELQTGNAPSRLSNFGISCALNEFYRLESREKHGEALGRVLRMRHGLSWMARDKKRITSDCGRQIIRMFE